MKKNKKHLVHLRKMPIFAPVKRQLTCRSKINTIKAKYVMSYRSKGFMSIPLEQGLRQTFRQESSSFLRRFMSIPLEQGLRLARLH